MTLTTPLEDQLRMENANLRVRLAEAEETLRAVSSGAVELAAVNDISSRKEAETNLLNVTRRFEVALSMAPVTLFQQDLDLRYTWIYNPAFGYNSEHVIGKRDGDLFERAQDAANTEAIKREVMRTGARQRRDILVHAEGVHHYYDLLVEPLIDKGGFITGVTCAAIEITERRRSAAEAQRVSALLDTLLHNAHIGFCFLDRDLRFVRINERLAQMNGVPVEAHLGRHVSEIVPELVESLREMTGRIVATGEPMLNHAFSGQTPAAPGVTRFWNESWYPVRDGAGDCVGFGRVVEEITERMQAEEALRQSEGRFRALSIASSEVGYSMSPDWSEMRTLDGRSFLASAEAGSRTWLQDYNHPEDQPKIMARVRECIRTKSIFELEHRVRRLDGTWGWTFSRAVPILNAQGEIIEWFGTASDVTARKESEAEMRETTALLRAISSSTGDVIFAKDREGRLTYANPATLTLIGKPMQQVLGKTDAEFLDDKSAARRVMANDRRIMDSGIAEEVEEPVPLPDGTLRIWLSRKAPHHDENGKVVGLLGISRDMTQGKLAADALRESQQFTRRVLDSLSSFVGVTTVDGTLTEANRVPHEAAGIPASEVLGKKFWDCSWWNYSPEIQAQVRDACERAANGEIVRYDVPARMAGDVRVWIDFQVAPLRDTEGRITHLIPSAVDIAERRAAEENLRASDERTLLATEATAVGIWEWNVPTETIRWDAQMFRLYGIAPTPDGFVQYSDWRDSLLPEDLPENERILQDTVRRGERSRRQFRIRRRDDGAERYIESVETVRANAQGETEWVVGTNLDVTEQRTAALQLRQLAADLSEADRRKDEFLATLAHELRNPLAPIRTGLQLMKTTGLPAATVEKTRSMLDRQLTHMVRLIDDLMDVSRISRGKLELQRERIALAAVVNSAVESSSPLIEQMGHQLTVSLPRQEIFVDADMTRLAQVVLNLLNNAAKYSDRGGHIQLSVEREGDDAVVTVKDTGIGIAADQLPRVFDMFTQVGGSPERSQGGLGIGLTLVARLVNLHGGQVEARSEGLGKGSAFAVRLPVAVDPSRPLAPGVEDEPAATKSSLRVLIVDDNRDGTDSLAEMLRMMGNDTRTAYDGQQGVAVAGEYRPDVILLDIGLPLLNGYEACRLIRQQPWGQGVLLIAVTGWGQDEDRRRSHDAGFDHHMVKPVDAQALMSMIAVLTVAHTDPSINRSS